MIALFKQKNNTLLFYLGIGLILGLVGLILHATTSPIIFIEYVKHAVVLLFLVNIGISLLIQKLPIYHPYLIFLGMIGLFILSRIVFDVLGGADFAQTTQFSHYVFAEDIQIRLLTNVYLALFGLQVGAIISTSYYPIEKKTYSEDIDWKYIGLVLFYIGLPFMIYQYLMIGMEVMEKGYGAHLSGDIEYRNSLLTTFMTRSALGGFFFYIAGKPKGKWFCFHTAVFLITFYLQLLEGGRYYVMSFSLVFMSIIFIIREAKMRIHHLLIVLVFLFLTSSIVGIYRSGNKNVQQGWVSKFINQQGFALQIIGHSIEYKDKVDYQVMDMFAHARYRFDLMKGRFTHKGMELEKVKQMRKYNTLAFQLTYNVNSRALVFGWDMASSYLAEFFLLGREWLMFFGNVLVGFFTMFFSNKAFRSKYGIVLLLYLLPYWIFIPRDNIFDFITDNMSNVIFLAYIVILIYVYKKVNNKLPRFLCTI